LAAVDKVSFVCLQSTVTAIIGPNGSGKTSTLNAITGIAACSGSVQLSGMEVSGSTPRQMFSHGLVRTFQNLDLIDERSVLDNVALGATTTTKATILESLVSAPRSIQERRQRRAAAEKAVELLGIQEVAHRRTGELSYGLRRRVEVARALASTPKVVLLDEPTAGMGPAESAEFGQLLLHVAKELSIAVVVIEHDMSVVRAAASSVCVLAGGKLIAEGKPDVVLNSELVRRVYLGDDAGI
jgi:branched-chain amino acid transport system ATP-binding protein